jgi:hypothetical protein
MRFVKENHQYIHKFLSCNNIPVAQENLTRAPKDFFMPFREVPQGLRLTCRGPVYAMIDKIRRQRRRELLGMYSPAEEGFAPGNCVRL